MLGVRAASRRWQNGVSARQSVANTPQTACCRETALDKFDQRIIALLREDARTPVSRIAREVNLSRSAVGERIRQLEQAGVIRGYHARIASPDGAVRAFFELFYREGRCQEHVERLRALAEVRQCCGISGETDMMLLVEAPSMERLCALREEIEAFPGLQRIKTHMVVREWPM